MRILFDHHIPGPLRRYLPEHTVDTPNEKGWPELRNGDLLNNADTEGYEVVITADQSLRCQQNIGHWQIAVIGILSNRWPDVQLKIKEIRSALEDLDPGELREVPI